MTRPHSRWRSAIALVIAAAPLIAAAPAALAQMPAPGPMAPGPMTPGPQMPQNMPPPPPVAPPPTLKPTTPGPPGVAALVNGTKITRTQVANQALSLYGPQILNTMILIELIKQESAKQHVVITPAQINAQLAVIQQRAAAQFPGGLTGILASRHQSLASFKEQLLPQMEAEALVEKSLPRTPVVTQYHAQHLLIATAPLGPAMAPGAKPPHTDAEALAIIAKAQAELKAGKSFTDVANEYTEDQSGKGKGGDLPLFSASSQFDPAFLAAAIALKPGEVTPTPVKSQFGYHLIKLDSTSAMPGIADKNLYTSTAADQRRQQVEAAIPNYVQTLLKNAKVENYLGQ